MIKRHRDTQPVVLGKVHSSDNMSSIIDDVTMTQCCTFGQPGRATGELYIDGITLTQIRLSETRMRIRTQLITGL